MRLPPPLAGRECGECTACCIELGIDDPQLRKPDHVACPHMIAGQGCAIHATRPQTCRNWYCGWRILHLSDAMRPDRAHIMLAPELDSAASGGKGGLRIVVLHEDRAALLQEELLTLVARCVKGGAPIFLSWGHGAFAKRVSVNDAAKHAVADGDKAQFVTILRDLLDRLALQVAMEAIVAQGQGGS
jgi:hypothetical protein